MQARGRAGCEELEVSFAIWFDSAQVVQQLSRAPEIVCLESLGELAVDTLKERVRVFGATACRP